MSGKSKRRRGLRGVAYNVRNWTMKQLREGLEANRKIGQSDSGWQPAIRSTARKDASVISREILRRRGQLHSRDTSPEKGFDVLQYSSGRSYVEPSTYGRPMYRTRREAENAKNAANALWEASGAQSQHAQLRSFFSPASRDKRKRRARRRRR